MVQGSRCWAKGSRSRVERVREEGFGGTFFHISFMEEPEVVQDHWGNCEKATARVTPSAWCGPTHKHVICIKPRYTRHLHHIHTSFAHSFCSHSLHSFYSHSSHSFCSHSLSLTHANELVRSGEVRLINVCVSRLWHHHAFSERLAFPPWQNVPPWR